MIYCMLLEPMIKKLFMTHHMNIINSRASIHTSKINTRVNTTLDILPTPTDIDKITKKLLFFGRDIQK